MNGKRIKSKINTGLSRSKSAYGTKKQEVQRDKYRLDLSPQERLKDDLQRKINQQVKQGIKELVNDRYAHLENILHSNMITRSAVTCEEPRSITNIGSH